MGDQNWTTDMARDGRPVLTDRARYQYRRNGDVRHRNPEMALGVLGPGVEIVLRALSQGCSAVRKDPTPPEMGQRFLAGPLASGKAAAGALLAPSICTPAQKAWSIRCSAVASAVPHARDRRWAGVLRRERRHVHGAGFQNRNPVWHFETGQDWRASPMTYMVGGTQYVVLAGLGGIFSFALTQ